MKKHIPKVYQTLYRNEIMPTLYASEWFITLFTRQLDFSVLVRIFDCFLLEGFKVIYRFSLAFLKMRQDNIVSAGNEMADVMNEIKMVFDDIDMKKLFEEAFKFSISRAYIRKCEEDYERYKVSFYVDSTETPKEEIEKRLNDALKNTGLASGKENIEIEVDEIIEEEKELLVDADEDTLDKEFTVTEINEDNVEKLHELVENSAFTWEGMNASDENLQAIVDDFKENTDIKLPVNFYKWNGELFNEVFGLSDANAYQNDLTFLSVDLDNWSDIGKLPIYKMRVGARWLDDIVDNNARRGLEE